MSAAAIRSLRAAVRRAAPVLLIGVLLSAARCDGDGGGGGADERLECTGDLHGAPATATVTLERLPEYTIAAGEIRSAVALYTFTADLVGDSGFGDLLDHTTNQRTRIRIDVVPGGFVLTNNAFEGGGATSYPFQCP